MNGKISIDSLIIIKKILDSHRIEYWLDYGTLLGAVRDGQVIPWDGDIDLGTWDSNLKRIAELYYEFLDNGFRLSFNTDEINIFNKTKKIYTGGIYLYQLKKNIAVNYAVINKREFYFHNNKLDVHRFQHWLRVITKNLIYYLEDDDILIQIPPFIFKKIIITCVPYRQLLIKIIKIVSKKLGIEFPEVIIPSDQLINLETIKFHGEKFNIPSKVEEYLSLKYGDNWKKPKKDFIPFVDSIYQKD